MNPPELPIDEPRVGIPVTQDARDLVDFTATCSEKVMEALVGNIDLYNALLSTLGPDWHLSLTHSTPYSYTFLATRTLVNEKGAFTLKANFYIPHVVTGEHARVQVCAETQSGALIKSFDFRKKIAVHSNEEHTNTLKSLAEASSTFVADKQDLLHSPAIDEAAEKMELVEVLSKRGVAKRAILWLINWRQQRNPGEDMSSTYRDFSSEWLDDLNTGATNDCVAVELEELYNNIPVLRRFKPKAALDNQIYNNPNYQILAVFGEETEVPTRLPEPTVEDHELNAILSNFLSNPADLTGARMLDEAMDLDVSKKKAALGEALDGIPGLKRYESIVADSIGIQFGETCLSLPVANWEFHDSPTYQLPLEIRIPLERVLLTHYAQYASNISARRVASLCIEFNNHLDAEAYHAFPSDTSLGALAILPMNGGERISIGIHHPFAGRNWGYQFSECPEAVRSAIIKSYPEGKILKSIIKRITAEQKKYSSGDSSYLTFTDDFMALPLHLRLKVLSILKAMGIKDLWLEVLRVHGHEGGISPEDNSTYKSKDQWIQVFEKAKDEPDPYNFVIE